MTLSTTANKVSYAGDGVTLTFAIPFLFLQDDHIEAVLRDAAGGEFTWVRNTEYTLSGSGNAAGGTLTVLTGPTDYTPVSGETLVIRRVVPETQETDYPEGGAFPASAHEQALDKLTMLTQQHSEEIARALRLPVSSALSDIRVPEPGAGGVIRWNAAGTALEATPIGDLSLDIAAVLDNPAAGDSLVYDGAAWRNVSHPGTNVRAFGATGDGTTDDRAAIASALAAAAGGTVYFPQGTYRVASALTLAAGTACEFANGAVLKPDSGIGITVAGEVQAGNWQIFDVSASGSFDTKALNRVNVKWWGARGDNTTDDTVELQACIDSGGGANDYVVYFPPGDYRISDTLNVDEFTTASFSYDRLYFVGDSRASAQLIQTVDGKSCLDFKAQTPATNSARFNKVGIMNMSLRHDESSGSSGYCLDIEGVDQFALHNCQLSSATGSTRTLMRTYEFTNSWVQYNEFNNGGTCIEGRAAATLGNYFNMIQNNQFLDFSATGLQWEDGDECVISGNQFLGPNGTSADQPVVNLRGDQRKLLFTGNLVLYSSLGLQIGDAGARIQNNAFNRYADANNVDYCIKMTTTAVNPAASDDAKRTCIIGNSINADKGNSIHISGGDAHCLNNVCINTDGNAQIVLTCTNLTKNVYLAGNVSDTAQINITSGSTVDATVRFRPQDNKIAAGQRAFERSSVPSSQWHEVGERVENTGVSAGGSPGWVCTTAGSPGTWKAGANVAI